MRMTFNVSRLTKSSRNFTASPPSANMQRMVWLAAQTGVTHKRVLDFTLSGQVRNPRYRGLFSPRPFDDFGDRVLA